MTQRSVPREAPPVAGLAPPRPGGIGRRLARWVVTLLLVAAPPVAADAVPPSHDPGAPVAVSSDPRVDLAIDSIFRHLDRTHTPGAAVLVMRGGEVIHRAGYGMANLEHGVPVDPSSVFDIASVSKQFAGMAVAMLVEEGRLGMDDEVRGHIPELPDFGRPVTVRHLVHHTSGLRDWPGTLRLAGWDYEDVISYEQILQMAFHQQDLNFHPGDDYAYSNTGYNLLAELVARVTGQSFSEWTRTRIFEPLGMMDTHFYGDHSQVVPRRATSYRPDGDGGFRRVGNALTALGSSSLFTTVDDLERWLRHLDDPSEDLGGRAVVDRLHTPGLLNSGDTVRYGFGLNLGEHRGLRTVSHGGSWAGYRTHLLRYPDHELSVVVLGNRSDLNAGGLARQVAERLLEDRMGDPEEAAPTVAMDGEGDSQEWAPEPDELGDFVGEYASAELFTGYRITRSGDELVFWHFRHGSRMLTPNAPDLFLAPGLGLIRFERDQDGAVTSLLVTAGARNRDIRFERVR